MPKDLEKKYSQKYKKAWEDENGLKDWIAPDPVDNTMAFCKYCKVSMKAHKKGLLSHNSTTKHKSAIGNEKTALSCRKIDEKFQPVMTEISKIAELKIAAFIAEHSSINTTDHLLEILPKIDGKSKTLSILQMHRTKCSMLIKNVLGPCMLLDLMEEVGNSAYSLIIDETTDISTQKILCVMIRFYSTKTKRIVTTFYKMIKLTYCDAQSIYDALKNQLEIDGLFIQNLVGIGVDGANVMIGRHHSVTSLLKNEIDDLIIVKCICHSLHLCAEKAAQLLPSKLEFLVREIHNYFSHSSKRVDEYRTLYAAINNNKYGKKVQGLSGTRWLARHAAVKTILDQWVELELMFSLAKTRDKCYMANQLHDIMNDKCTKLFLCFLNLELKGISNLNLLFQSNNVQPHKLFEDVFLYYKNLLQKISVPEQLSKISDSELTNYDFQNYILPTNSIYFGYDFENEAKKIDARYLQDIKNICKNFLITLAEEIQKRLPENLCVLKSLADLDPKIATSQKKPSLKTILSKISRTHLFGNKEDIEYEWKQLQNKQWNNLNSSEDFYSEVVEDTDSGGNKRFPNLSKFALAFLSLPFSNAEVERAFSIYSILKTKIRNKLSLDMLNSLLMVRYTLKRYGNCVNFTPTTKMLQKFNYTMYDFKCIKDEEDECALIEEMNVLHL